ncbi:sulfite exporter TauE/SafE family protein, partial [Ideonella sp.]|uniref:sulfite exporter TauE/SafE family protein n=1 Tax=Ideonella sp. TaxID=1929293 RepID=UPI003BB50D1A
MIETSLILSAFLLGLGGMPHCAAMCGGACAALTRSPAGASAMPASLGFHLARAASYAAVGALLGWGVALLPALSKLMPVLRPVWTLLQAGMLALGLWLLITARMPAWLGRIGRPGLAASASAGADQPIRWMGRPAARATLAGALWAGWPCGLLQSAFLIAALANGPAGGAAVMASFALASAPGLWLGPWLWRRYGQQ